MLWILIGLAGEYVAYEAQRYVGVPYRYGGMDMEGMDCSGLVNVVFSKFGVRLPRRSRDMVNVGRAVELDSVLPGDILLFSSRLRKGVIDHVGIYVGGGKFVHASSSRGVVVDSLNAYYLKRLRGIRRLEPSKEYYFSQILDRIRSSAFRLLMERPSK